MAIQEVVDWSTETKGNQAVHPTSPEGQRAVRISSSFQELQAAIARWRDSLDAIGGSITDNQIAVGATTADEIEGSAELLYTTALGVQIISTTPQLRMQDTDAPADEEIWDIDLASGFFTIKTRNDADSSGANAIQINRNGTAITNISFESSLFTFSNGQAKFAAGTTSYPSINIAEGVAPTSPVDGDHWLTAAGGFFVRLNGVSVDLAANTGPPAGMVADFAQATAPTGWLECDGSSVSRTTYADLFTAIGVTYGNVDANTFNLPDYRGEFRRSWDHGAGVDPDAASRTNRGDGTTGDNVGTKQAGEIEEHTHPYGAANVILDDNVGTAIRSANSEGAVTTDATGGNETRPINTNVLTCIKY